MMTREQAAAELRKTALLLKARDVECDPTWVVDYRADVPPYLRIFVVRADRARRRIIRDVNVWFTDDGQMVTSNSWPNRKTARGIQKPVPCAGIAGIKRIIAEKRVELREEAARRLAAKQVKATTVDTIATRVVALARRHRFQYVLSHKATQSTLIVCLDDLNEAHIAIPHKDPAVVLGSVPTLVKILREMWLHRARVQVKCRPAVRTGYYTSDRRGPRKWLGVKPKVKPSKAR